MVPQDCIKCLCPLGRKADGNCLEPVEGETTADEESAAALAAEEESNAAFTADAESSGRCLGGSVRLVREGFWRAPGALASPIYRCIKPNLCKGITKEKLNE